MPRKTIGIIAAFCILVACKPNKNKFTIKQETAEPPAVKHPITLTDLKDKFKYHDVKVFNIDSLPWDGLDMEFMRVDSTAFRLIFQEGERKFMDDRYEQDYYYSWQNRNKNLTEFTILTPDESSNCLLLRYYIFNKQGKFISKFDVASKCGDGGWVLTAKCEQIGATTFNYDMVEYEGDLSDNTEEGDSTRFETTINSNGKTTEKEIYKKHFKRKEQ